MDVDQREAATRALLRRCAAREPRALEQLYSLAGPLLFGLLTRMLRRHALAEEALQDVFVRIWQRAGQYQEERGSALAWLIGIARYRAIDLLRQERAAPVLMPAVPETAAGDADQEPHPPTPTALLERCLARLSDDQQRCLQFAFINGRSHQEISQLTGNPLGTVKSWIRRALFALRECLES
ncbi:MAG: sigma-70 family RNA polymerase sigma factor [Gammaproteobacteria bacterium]|nr:sigma-70 family RNA polymerase sigma factor [Gammaproteobacteria bacterium]MDE2251241.1 sigma-70 family RNA polymerase sigma factor [Gammaproteobacteria bacterium]